MRTMVLLVVGLLLTTATTAEPNDPSPSQELGIEIPFEANCGDSPCGFITPILSLEFPTKQACGGYRYVYADTVPDDCDMLMAEGESMRYPGYITFAWDCLEEPTYPIDPTQTIVFEFGPTANNPDWMSVRMEPQTFTFGIADLYDAENYNVDPSDSSCWFQYEADVDAIFERTGPMDNTCERKINGWNGLLKMFIKGKSSAVDPNYRESYGVEEFRWLACQETSRGCPGQAPTGTDSNEAPGLGLVLSIGLLGAIAFAHRRRFS